MKHLMCFSYCEKDLCLLQKTRAVREKREPKRPGSTSAQGSHCPGGRVLGGASSLVFTRSEGSLSVQCDSGGTRWGSRGARLLCAPVPAQVAAAETGRVGWGATWGSQVLKGNVAPAGRALALPPAPFTRRQALNVAF